MKLTINQEKAINEIDNHLQIVACAGSGKTEVITRRIANIIVSKSVDDEIQNFIPKITVMGVGGAGCNAVNNMIEQGIDNVDFVVDACDAG